MPYGNKKVWHRIRFSEAIAGTMDIHIEAEEKCAEFKGVESSLIYSSGYAANVGLIPSSEGQMT